MVNIGLEKLVRPCMNGGSLPSGGEERARKAGWSLGESRHWVCHWEMASWSAIGKRAHVVPAWFM